MCIRDRSEEEIKARVQELGDRLYDRFKDKNPMFVGVLNAPKKIQYVL